MGPPMEVRRSEAAVEGLSGFGGGPIKPARTSFAAFVGPSIRGWRLCSSDTMVGRGQPLASSVQNTSVDYPSSTNTRSAKHPDLGAITVSDSDRRDDRLDLLAVLVDRRDPAGIEATIAKREEAWRSANSPQEVQRRPILDDDVQ